MHKSMPGCGLPDCWENSLLMRNPILGDLQGFVDWSQEKKRRDCFVDMVKVFFFSFDDAKKTENITKVD